MAGPSPCLIPFCCFGAPIARRVPILDCWSHTRTGDLYVNNAPTPFDPESRAICALVGSVSNGGGWMRHHRPMRRELFDG